MFLISLPSVYSNYSGNGLSSEMYLTSTGMERFTLGNQPKQNITIEYAASDVEVKLIKEEKDRTTKDY